MSQLKEQNGKYYQQCKVVILSNQDSKSDIRRYMSDSVYKLHTNFTALDKRSRYSETISYEHLYILSNEEIKEGDYVFMSMYKEIRICDTSDKASMLNEKQYRNIFIKIIATTDTSLGLPQPSQSFIKKYIEEYNKDNTIKNVLVEFEIFNDKSKERQYSLCSDFTKEEYFDLIKSYRLKLDLDNTITIKKIKDIYSREEVNSLLIQLSTKVYELGKRTQAYYMSNIGQPPLTLESFINNWIEQNL